MKKLHLIAFTLLVFFFVSLNPVFADEVTDSINEGLKNYKDGNFTEAVTSLEYAAQLIRQKKGGAMKDLLPAPLSGWNAEDAKSQAVGGAMLGGGVQAERNYTKGNARINIEIITDSPMLQGMMMMFTNPMFATSDGGKMEKIKGQKAIVKFDTQSNDGSINIVVANRFLVKIEGNDTSVNDMKAYAEKIDYDKLTAMP